MSGTLPSASNPRQSRIVRRASVAALGALAVLARPVDAADIRVPKEVDTIQAAIALAAPGDRILVSAGVWAGPIEIVGKSIVLEAVDGPEVTTIDGLGQIGFAVSVRQAGGAGTDLRGFSVTGGRGVPGSGGGGVLVEGGSARLVDCVIRGNVGITGGGLRAIGANLSIETCRFEGNDALIGGGLGVEGGAVTMRGASFEGNRATSFGGGAAFLGTNGVSVEDSSWRGNRAGSFGGGIYANQSQLAFRDLEIEGNGETVAFEGGSFSIQPIGGGGIYTTSCSGTIDAMRLLDNHGSFGAAAYFAGAGNLLVANALVVGNGRVCDCATGAIYLNSSSPTFVNGTVVGNGGFVGMFTTYNSFPVVANSIVVGAADGSAPQQSFGGNGRAIVSHSLVQGIPFAAEFGPGIRFLAGSPMLDPDRSFVPLPGSPAIDAGSNAAVPAEIVTDLRGFARFVDDPETPDIGEGKAPIVDLGASEFGAEPPIGALVGDMDRDGTVGPQDLAMLLAAWGPCGSDCPADLDRDGRVDAVDLLVLLAHWGSSQGG